MRPSRRIIMSAPHECLSFSFSGLFRQSMRFAYPKWMFVLFWVLLVSFGPSFHHADVFGLHGNSCGSSWLPSFGCCSCSHGATYGAESDGPIVQADHDCSLCDFFDHYNLILDGPVPSESTEPAFYCHAVLAQQSLGDCFSPIARGPPSVAHA